MMLYIKWFDFTDTTFLCIFILGIILFLALLFFVISSIILRTKDHNHFIHLRNEINTTRIFVLDLNNDKVTIFNRYNPKYKIIQDTKTFYGNFSSKDKHLISNWLLDVCIKADENNRYLEVRTKKNPLKKRNILLLKFVSYNPDAQKIHLESYMYRYLTTSSSLSKREQRKENYVLKSLDDFNSYIARNKSINGAAFCISLVSEDLSPYKTKTNMMGCFYAIRNILGLIASKSRGIIKLYIIDRTHIVLYSSSITTKEKAIDLVYKIRDGLNREILILGYEEKTKLYIGVAMHANYYHDANALIQHSKEASIIASTNDKDYCFYERSVALELYEDKYLNEVDSLIKAKKIRFLYRPIVDVNYRRIFGYISNVRFSHSIFETYSGMMKSAAKANKSKELFSYVINSFIPKYISETPSTRAIYFLPISVYDLKYLDDVLHQIEGLNKIKLILVLPEFEINDEYSDEIRDNLINLKLLGYNFALYLDRKAYFHDEKIMKIFDYFLISSRGALESKSSLMQQNLRSLIESVLKYKKPIVSVGLESWKLIELMVKSGITLISGTAIADYNEMILPIPKKKIDKIVALIK